MSLIKTTIYTIFLLVLFSFSGSVSRDKGLGVSGGIVFSGNHQKPVGNSERAKKLPAGKISSLHITNDELINLKSNYSISFSATFWYNFTSGNIFTVKNSSYTLNLKYIASPENDTVFLILSLNNKPSNAIFSFNKREIHEGNKFIFKIDVDEAKGKISLSINNKERTLQSSPFVSNDDSEIFFGAAPGDTACAPMILQDLQIRIAGNLEHRYIFNEMEGDTAYDSEGGLDAHATNHQWLINRHFFWEYHDSLSYSKKNFLRLWQNPYSQELGIVTISGMDVYSFFDGSRRKIKYVQPFKNMVGSTGFPNHDLITGFYTAYPDDEVATFDFKNGILTGGLIKYTPEGYLYGSTGFVDSKTKSVYSIGGYGWYKARNQLIKFNESSRKWEEIKLNGDFFTPRYNLAVLPSEQEDVYYLFGGYGNKTGNQKDGFYNLYDLYKFDLDTKTITKIYDWGRKTNFIVHYQGLWTDSAKSGVYTMVNAGSEQLPLFRLGKVTVGDTALAIVGDTNGVGNFKPLNGTYFINYLMSRFYSVLTTETDTTVTVHVFSVKTPILTEAEYKELYAVSPHGVGNNRFAWPRWGIAFMALLLLPFGFVYLFKFRRKKKVKSQTGSDHETIVAFQKIKQPETNLITMFGGFHIFDGNGHDIAKDLTPKQLELLSLVAIFSFNGRNQGIEFEKIDKLLWSDSPAENLRGNRNALLSKTRAVLKSVEGVSLNVHHTSVELSAEDKYANEIKSYFMLKRYFSDKSQIKDGDSFNNFLKIVKRGKFLENLPADWADKLRAEEESDIIRIAILFLNEVFSREEYVKCIETADSVSIHDPLNEELLGFKVRSLYNLGRHSIALEVYNTFCREYESFFNEAFGTSFRDILKN